MNKQLQRSLESLRADPSAKVIELNRLGNREHDTLFNLFNSLGHFVAYEQENTFQAKRTGNLKIYALIDFTGSKRQYESYIERALRFQSLDNETLPARYDRRLQRVYVTVLCK